MNQEIQTEWVKRLRDGRPQTTSLLERLDENGQTTGQCCIGVLGEILLEKGIIPADESVVKVCGIDVDSVSDGQQARSYGRYDPNSDYAVPYDRYAIGMLPPKYLTAVGLSQSQADDLAAANDDGVEFEEIAKVVEEF